MAVDLHTHTTFSDGSLSPQLLIKKADEQKLTAIAITDHDEIKGNFEALKLIETTGLQLVPGAEFSIDMPLKGTAHLHLLGLFLNMENDELNSTLNFLRNDRKKRAEKIINQLKEQGFPFNNSDLDILDKKGSIGRPHIAKLMLEKKIVNSVWEAFNKFLSKGKVGYVPKKKLTLKQAIDIIHKSEGLAVLAHPASLKHKQYRETEAMLNELANSGLDGVEAYHPSHSKNYSRFLLKSVQKNGLLVSGGSDFHGDAKPDIELGSGKGDLFVPDQVYWDLKNALRV
jgi:hypothetical protein